VTTATASLRQQADDRLAIHFGDGIPTLIADAGDDAGHPANPDDVQRMREAQVHAFLVGEAFMRAKEPGEALATLFA
jgi:hypothetical protein